jgi:hypothetical protein
MENKSFLEKKDFGSRLQEVFKKISLFFARWFFMMSLLAAAAFCIFVWYSFIWNADWDDAKKQTYINEQAKFSFDETGYKKTVDMMENRKNKLENFPRFTGRDIFYPEGF